MRREPSEASEMVSQVLFGEEFQILETDHNWAYIELDFDNCQGWVERKSIFLTGQEAGPKPVKKGGIKLVSLPFITVVDLKLGQQLILPAGSLWSDTSHHRMIHQDRAFEVVSEEGLLIPGPDVDPEKIGRDLVSLPHIWGGRSGFGFDSAGLVQMVCRMMGTPLPRHCQLQARMGATINLMQETRKGDLAFFDNLEGEIEHVGMVLDGGRILHCHRQVSIDRLDQQGIFSMEKKDYTHKLRVVKRVLA